MQRLDQRGNREHLRTPSEQHVATRRGRAQSDADGQWLHRVADGAYGPQRIAATSTQTQIRRLERRSGHSSLERVRIVYLAATHPAFGREAQRQ